MKAYFIVSLVMTPIFFTLIVVLLEKNGSEEAASVWTFIVGLYALIFSIIGVAWSTRKEPKSTTMMVMSIIGIIIFLITVILAMTAFGTHGSLLDNRSNAAAGWGIFTTLYLLSLSIVALVQSSNSDIQPEYIRPSSFSVVAADLEKLNDLRKRGVISEKEFEEKKQQIL